MGKEIKDEKLIAGQRVLIPVAAIEFNVGSNTIWIQSPQGGTTLRLKCTGKIIVDQCTNSPLSHSDIIIDGDINFCLSDDAEGQ
jgi:hypothetical protein